VRRIAPQAADGARGVHLPHAPETPSLCCSLHSLHSRHQRSIVAQELGLAAEGAIPELGAPVHVASLALAAVPGRAIRSPKTAVPILLATRLCDTLCQRMPSRATARIARSLLGRVVRLVRTGGVVADRILAGLALDALLCH